MLAAIRSANQHLNASGRASRSDDAQLNDKVVRMIVPKESESGTEIGA
jgi:hypothetical protein